MKAVFHFDNFFKTAMLFNLSKRESPHNAYSAASVLMQPPVQNSQQLAIHSA